MMTTVFPGGLDVFFEELQTVTPDGAAPDLKAVVAIFEKHGLELLGPPLAKRAMAVACGAD